MNDVVDADTVYVCVCCVCETERIKTIKIYAVLLVI